MNICSQTTCDKKNIFLLPMAKVASTIRGIKVRSGKSKEEKETNAMKEDDLHWMGNSVFIFPIGE